ncbi:signal peptidase II [Novosphingobium sp.]|uniref:signal peptidase II n=1 Tax=Novosphingobium sp. TaxID=1874826 RepID=UPI0035B1E38B
MTLTTRNRLLGLALAVLVYVLDQWVKGYVTGTLKLTRDGDQVVLLPFFNLTLTSNYGVSLGMFTAQSMEMRLVLLGATALIALVVLVWMLRERLSADILPLGLVLGGALGNIKDRWTYGFVVDYADLHFGEWRPFLIFNLADAAITLGVLFILARSFLSREKRDDNHAAPVNSSGPATES